MRIRNRRRPTRFRPELRWLEDRLAPAVLYLAGPSAFTDLGGGKVALATGANQTTTLTTGTNAFTDFNAAVAAADANADASNTLRILSGSFAITAQAPVTKNLSVIGYGIGQTTLTAGFGTGHSGDSQALILVSSGVTFNLSSLAFDGGAGTDNSVAPTFNVAEGVRYLDDGSTAPVASIIDHVDFRNMRDGAQPADGYFGLGVRVNNGTVAVDESAFTNMGRIGVEFFGPRGGGSAVGNTFTGNGAGDKLNYGIEVNAAVVTIQGNTFSQNLGVASVDGSESAGILVDYFPNGSPPQTAPTAIIENNTFSNNRNSLIIGTVPEDLSVLTIDQNNFGTVTNNGIESPRTATFSAANNFWGSALGPFNALHNPTGDPANPVSDAVTPLAPFAAAAFPLTFTPPAGSIASVAGQISGQVTKTANGAPVGVAGVMVFLDTNGNGTLDDGEISTVTDANGNYTFDSQVVSNGGGTAYTIKAVVPAPFTTPTNPLTATLTAAAPTATGQNFALVGIATTTTVASSANPQVVTSPVTFTATVTGASGTPTGSVTFSIDGTAAQTVALAANGTATFTTSSLTVGSHAITADFVSDDGTFVDSSGSLTQSITAITTTTTVTSSANPQLLHSAVTFTATVTGTSGTPTGSVNFSIDGTAAQTVALAADGTATFTTSTLAVGSHTITADFVPGNANFTTSTGTLTQNIVTITTTTTVTAAPNPVDAGQTVTFTATITPTGANIPPGAIPTDGVVTFLVDGVAVGTANAPATSSGSFQVTFTTSSLTAGSHSVTATYAPGTDTALVGSTSPAVALTVNAVTPPTTQAVAYAVGSGPGEAPEVKVFDSTGKQVFDFVAYDSAFTLGVHVAVADVNGDGVNDIITGADAGGGPHVKVFSGKDLTVLFTFYAYDSKFRGGVFVAGADLNGDGKAEIVTGAGPGGGPHVKVFDGASGTEIRSFYAYDPAFRGGVSVAALANDSIVTGAGPGGGPHVKVFSFATGVMTQSFYAYDPSFRGGVFVAAGNLGAGAGTPFIVTGNGADPNSPPEVKTFKLVDGGGGDAVKDFNAYDPKFHGGVTVATTVVNGTNAIVTGAGPGGGPHVKVLDGDTLAELITGIYAFGEPFRGGVFVG